MICIVYQSCVCERVHAICGECTYVYLYMWWQKDNCGSYSSETGHLTSCSDMVPGLGLPDLAKLAGRKDLPVSASPALAL